MARRRGTCFGFEVHSDLGFHYLREGTGDALEVSTGSGEHASERGRLVAQWLPQPARPLHADLYDDGARFHLWIEDGGWFTIDPQAGRISLPDTTDTVRREERLWGIPAVLCFLRRGDLPIHAAAVEVEGRAMLLAAPGRLGKTTLAAAFFQAGFRLLSEDLTCLRLTPSPAVIPGPAMLRVRRDIFRHLQLAGADTVAESSDRISLAVAAPRRGDCRPVPLHAVVLLKPGANGLKMERAAPAESLRDLWALSFRVPTDADLRRCFAGITDLARTVPLWNLHRRLRIEDLRATVDQISTACLQDA